MDTKHIAQIAYETDRVYRRVVMEDKDTKSWESLSKEQQDHISEEVDYIQKIVGAEAHVSPIGIHQAFNDRFMAKDPFGIPDGETEEARKNAVLNHTRLTLDTKNKIMLFASVVQGLQKAESEQ